MSNTIKFQNSSGAVNVACLYAKKWRYFVIMLVAALFLIVLAVFGSALAPYSPIEVDYSKSLNAPNSLNLFGTDKLGRDIFSRVLCGAGNSFILTFMMVAIVSLTGTVIGVFSGYMGGKVDAILMRFTDILLAFPNLVFAIALVGIMGPGLVNTVIALSFVGWTGYARMSRSLVVSIKEKKFVIQAKMAGVKSGKLLIKYIFPNMISQIVIMALQGVGSMMLSLAALSFLGLASQPPVPEWGYMIYESRQYLQTAPWMMIFPGLALLVVVIVFNLLGDSLRDLLDPKENN